MNRSYFHHKITTLTFALALILIPALQSCDCGCGCCCDEPDVNKPVVWYKTNVVASYDREWYFPTSPRYDWTEHWPDNLGLEPNALLFPLPSGLRVATYTSADEAGHHNLDTFGGDVLMDEETTGLLLYNNDTEYIVFSNPDSFSDATATTRRRNIATYAGNRSVDSDTISEPVRSQPDMLYLKALRKSAIDSIVDVESRNSQLDTIHTLDVTLEPTVYVYVVHFTFDKGLEHVLNSSAAISGMSAGVNLSTGNTLDEACTLIFDCTRSSDGLTGTMMSFGAPGYCPSNQKLYNPNKRYGVTLRVVLSNTKILSFTADISSQMAAQPRGGVVMVTGLEITDEDAKPTGGGSFDVTVDPWGEPNDYEINL